jgi:protein-S-isoprenylcysteine O-methyltransferase
LRTAVLTLSGLTLSQLPAFLGAFYALSEIFLGITRRSGAGSVSRDRCSLPILWMIIGASIFFAQYTLTIPASRLAHREFCLWAGVVLFLAGVALRWYSIFQLGRFFTVDVAIAQKHQLVDSGPYRLIRHPSYTGALLAFVGFGLALGSWLAILCLIIPITAAFLWRIHVEEKALINAMGGQYRDYMSRTKRLVPFLY